MNTRERVLEIEVKTRIDEKADWWKRVPKGRDEARRLGP